ncbi:MAG: ATP-binding protein [Gemmatimonadaceae bacterium]|nr:ATP-binding protein [Gemmatimonadaceae bacterium]
MSTGEYGKVAIDPERPWPGLLSFPEVAARLFHGRGREVSELLRLLEAEPVTFLYGKSGLGKTSLLQAGLFPRLRERDRLPVYLRLGHGAGAPDAREQLFRALTAAMDQASIDGPRPLPDESAWSFLHRRGVEWWSPRNRLVRPVIVIDQFEELFTLGQESAEARERVAGTIDLLEELTTQRPGAAQRRVFDATPESIEGYDYDVVRYHVLFAFREDFLPQFDQLRERLRINPHHRLALERLTGADARDSVLGTGGRLVEPEVAETIVRFVAGDTRGGTRALGDLEVEPWLLSLVCEQVNERRLAATPVPRRISEALLTGSRDEILSQYYARCVEALDPRVPAFLEDRLLTEGGYRTPYPYDEAIRIDGITPKVIDELVDRRLVRREQQQGMHRLEVTHDVLGPVMLRYRQQRQSHERDAIGRLRTIAERRKAAEGRRRSGQLVVAATVLVTLIGVFAFLQSRAATRAERLLGWSRETQSHTYTALLQFIRESKDDEDARNAVDSLVVATNAVRRGVRGDPLLTSQELQYAFLGALAWGDSSQATSYAGRVLDLADSLHVLLGAGRGGNDAEFSYRLAGILAARRGDTLRLRDNLNRQLALLADSSLSTFNTEKIASAAMNLASLAPSHVDRQTLLRRAIDAVHQAGYARVSLSILDSLTGTISRYATAARDDLDLDSATVQHAHALARDAYSLRTHALEVRYEDDSTNTALRARYAGSLGNLAWFELLSGDYAASLGSSNHALRLDPSLDWIAQNARHARVFRGELRRMEAELLRLAPRQLRTATGTYAEVALQDIAVFRAARLRHPDLDRYEQLFRRSVR